MESCAITIQYLFNIPQDVLYPLTLTPHLSKRSRYCFYLFVLHGHTLRIWKLLGQALNLSQNCNLCHSFGKARP